MKNEYGYKLRTDWLDLDKKVENKKKVIGGQNGDWEQQRNKNKNKTKKKHSRN